MKTLVKITDKQTRIIEQKMTATGLQLTDVTREISFAKQIIAASSKLQQCTIESVMSAIINIANVGLTLNPVSKEAALVPRWNSSKRVNEAVLMPQYIGLTKLVIKEGLVSHMISNVVYENDVFQIDLSDDIKPVTHQPCLVKSDRGKKIGAYSIATLNNDKKHVEWMDIDTIFDIRQNSESFKYAENKQKKNSVWHLHEDEMIRKTVTRRHCKRLPRGNSEQLDNAMELDNLDYLATQHQLGHIELLLKTANITEPERNLIYNELENTQLSRSRADFLIHHCTINQLERSPRNGQMLSITELGSAVNEAVDRENT